MRIEDYKKEYEFYSGKLSEITRNLAYMGFGVVWILIGGLDGFKTGFIPPLLIWVLALLVLFQIFDISHYLYQTITWYKHFRKLEKNNEEDNENKYERNNFTADNKLAERAWYIYWSKITIIVVAFLLLLIYIVGLIF